MVGQQAAPPLSLRLGRAPQGAVLERVRSWRQTSLSPAPLSLERTHGVAVAPPAAPLLTQARGTMVPSCGAVGTSKGGEYAFPLPCCSRSASIWTRPLCCMGWRWGFRHPGLVRVTLPDCIVTRPNTSCVPSQPRHPRLRIGFLEWPSLGREEVDIY